MWARALVDAKSAPKNTENIIKNDSTLGNKYADYSAFNLYKTGFFTAGSNPKALLFAAAFLPQFIQASLPQVPQLLILLATFSVLEILWYFIYALGGLSMAQQLRKPSILRWFNRVTGGAFIGFAGLMAVMKG